MEACVDIISRELVKPSSPTPHDSREHKLSLLDRLAAFSFIPNIFFYKKQSYSKVVDPSEKTRQLKQSLSESLTKFYPLAGKLNPDLFSVDCDDSGVLFVEAKVDATLSQAVQNAPFENLGQYLPFEPSANGSDDNKLLLAMYPKNQILLAVQFTWFECGGNAIGVCISHKVADLASLVTFMNSWAAANRGESGKSLLKQPNFDLGRHLFPPPDFPVSFPPTADKGNIVCKKFLFNKEKLTELKELATSSSSLLVKDPTRVEVVTAFLWKHFINVARARSQGAKTMFMVCHVANLRSRMSSLALSSADEFPFGNLIIVTPASFTSDENQEETDYGHLVWLTSDAIRRVNDDFVLNCAVPFLKSLGTSTSGIEEVQEPKTMTSHWTFTSWCRCPTYEVDFGWGKPISVGPAGIPKDKGVMLTSTSNEDGIEAWIAMLEDELALLPDEFLSLAATDFFHVN